MNQRIQELATQAWHTTSDEVAHLNRIHNRSISQDEVTDIFEIKFAELIVKECAGIAAEQGNTAEHSFTATRAKWFRLGAIKSATMIKRTFGVE